MVQRVGANPGVWQAGRGGGGAGRARGRDLGFTGEPKPVQQGRPVPLLLSGLNQSKGGSRVWLQGFSHSRRIWSLRWPEQLHRIPTKILLSFVFKATRRQKKNTESQVKGAFGDPVSPFGQEPTESTCQAPSTSYHPPYPLLAQFNMQSFTAEHFHSGTQGGFSSTEEREES